MIEMTITDQVEARRKIEEFVNQCRLELSEELAELFENYTRWIWQYKCPGAIHKFYCDATTCYGGGGSVSVGADCVVAGTLGFMHSFPDRICEFVDIFVEGDEENGYSFGQTTRFNATNKGYSKFGPPTGKTLMREGKVCVSICECRVEKVEGRWRIIDEWVIESSDAITETLTPDIIIEEPTATEE